MIITLDNTLLGSTADAALEIQILEFFEYARGGLATETIAHVRGHARHVAVGHVTKTLVVALRDEIDERLRVDGQALEHLTRIVGDRAAHVDCSNAHAE